MVMPLCPLSLYALLYSRKLIAQFFDFLVSVVIVMLSTCACVFCLWLNPDGRSNGHWFVPGFKGRCMRFYFAGLSGSTLPKSHGYSCRRRQYHGLVQFHVRYSLGRVAGRAHLLVDKLWFSHSLCACLKEIKVVSSGGQLWHSSAQSNKVVQLTAR